MIVESCKTGDCSMNFGKRGGMSTATLSQRRKRRNREKVRGKKKERQREGRNQMSTATVAAKGTEWADIILIIYIIGRRVIFENKYLLTLAHLYIVINYANHSEGVHYFWYLPPPHTLFLITFWDCLNPKRCVTLQQQNNFSDDGNDSKYRF